MGDGAESSVVDFEEANRTTGSAFGSVDEVSLGTEARETETDTSAGLLDERGAAEGAEDAVVAVVAHVVIDGEHEARCELAKRRPGARESRTVREEPEGCHDAVIAGREVGNVALGVGSAGADTTWQDGPRGDRARDAPEHLWNGLGGLAVGSTTEVTPLEDAHAVRRDLQGNFEETSWWWWDETRHFGEVCQFDSGAKIIDVNWDQWESPVLCSPRSFKPQRSCSP